MSIPSSPRSPRHRRHPSSADLSPTNGFDQAHFNFPQTPRSPGPLSPEFLRQRNSQLMNGDERRMSEDYIGAVDSGGGLGSLADELAGAWGDEEGYEDTPGLENGHPQMNVADEDDDSYPEPTQDNTDTPRADPSSENHNTLQPPKARILAAQNRHHRRTESQYDGSDYGNDSDFDEPGDISPSLEARMASIESLVRRGTEENGSSNDQVIKRLIEDLRDLGAQSGIENGASRLITAHTSITSHLTHQTRALQTLIHPLLFSHFPLLSTEAIDTLIPLIDDELLPNLPFPFLQQPIPQPHGSQRPASSYSTSSTSSQSSGIAVNPLIALQSLLTQTSDLTHTLRTLSDTLHESRQLTSTASRRLRSARELVADLKREDEDRDEGHRWIEMGQWDRRLRDREAGRVCREVVSGFEAVCGEWREKLFGSAPTAGGPELAAA